MNINLENIDKVNAILSLTIEKEDYEQKVADVLKDYRQKASIPGFRPGKAPMGLIKKKYGAAVLVEEVNTLLSQNLSKYLIDEKLPVLGEPLPNEEKQKSIDWEKDETFEFAFDIALSPEVKVDLEGLKKLDYYKIVVADEMIDQQQDMAAMQLGQNVPVDEAKDNSTVRGNFAQLDAEGNEVEGGIAPEGVLVAVEKIKDEEIKKSFVGCKKDDIIVFDPNKAFDNFSEVSTMLNIEKEEAEALDCEFRFTVSEILQFEKAELNEELFKKLYGDDTEVKTIEDFREKAKKELAANLSHSSEYKFAMDARDTLVEKTEVELPEAFLKRWLTAVNKELTQEQIDKDFPAFILDLKWQLIKDVIGKENDLKVEPEEVKEFAKKMALAQFQQYGMFDVPDEQLDSFANMMMEKPEEKERFYKKIAEDKVVEVIKGKVKLAEKEISQEEFTKMMQPEA